MAVKGLLEGKNDETSLTQYHFAFVQFLTRYMHILRKFPQSNQWAGIYGSRFTLLLHVRA
jgi:hypothetical protein